MSFDSNSFLDFLIPIDRLRAARLLLAHVGQIDGLPVRQNELVLRVIDEAVFPILLLLLLVALDTGLVAVLPSQTVKIDVAVFTASYAVDPDQLLLVGTVVVLEAPRYRTVGIVLSPSSDYLFVKSLK